MLPDTLTVGINTSGQNLVYLTPTPDSRDRLSPHGEGARAVVDWEMLVLSELLPSKAEAIRSKKKMCAVPMGL